jgi:nitroreductase
MELYNAIETRRSIRGFTKPATEAQLLRIIRAGTLAISSGNCQPWEFIVVDEPELIEQIAEHKYLANLAGGRPKDECQVQKDAYKNCSVVAVCNTKGHGPSVSAWMCIQNMALAATAEGLGVIPSTFSTGSSFQQQVGKFLGLPDTLEVATVMLIGVQKGYVKGKKFPDITHRPDKSWLHKNQYGRKT